MVKHLRRLLYFPVLRNLREEEEYLAEIAEPAEEIINLNNPINLCETQTHHLRGNAPTINGCNHLIASDINRASGYIVNNPILAPQATMWGRQNAPHHQQPRSGCRHGSQDITLICLICVRFTGRYTQIHQINLIIIHNRLTTSYISAQSV